MKSDFLGELKRTTKPTIWSRIIGFFARIKQDRLDKKAAEQARIDYDILQRTPTFKVSVLGKTTYTDAQQTYTTHRWDLYEAPNGDKRVEFIWVNNLTYSKAKDGSDHPWHAFVITPWLNNLYYIDYDKTAEELGVPWGRRLKVNSN